MKNPVHKTLPGLGLNWQPLGPQSSRLAKLSSILLCFFFVALAMCLRSLLCGIPIHDRWWHLSSLDVMSVSCTLRRINPPPLHLPPNTASYVHPNDLKHFYSVLLWIILMFTGKLQTGLYMYCLVWALQDFSLSQRRVLPIVYLVTTVPAALRSLTGSWRVVLGCFGSVLLISATPWGEILHGAPGRERLTVILCFFPFVNYRANCCHLLTKLLGYSLVSQSSLV